MSHNRPLPPSPSLAHLKDQADDLSRAFAARSPGALARVMALDRFTSTAGQPGFRLSTAHAQYVIATEYGFASWPDLKHAIESGLRITTHPSLPANNTQEAPMKTATPAPAPSLRRDLYMFTLSLANLQKSGVPIIEGFEIAAGSITDPGFRAAVLGVKDALKGHLDVPAALKQHAGTYFDPMYVQMVAAGCETGKLDEMLIRLAGYMEMPAPPSLPALFARKLGVMAGAGLPLVQAIAIIAEQTDDLPFRRALEQANEAIKAGANFPEALAKHPAYFSPFYIGMMRAGDQGGNLDVMLDRVADMLQRAEHFNAT